MKTTAETTTKISTIDINALEWFDKVNGNSYFAGIVTVDYGTPNEQTFRMPFQYGYGDQYEHEVGETLHREGVIKLEDRQSLWRYCEENGIILRKNKQRGCKKSELKNI